MGSKNNENLTAESSGFLFWTPPVDFVVAAGADRHPVPLPHLPLPLHRDALAQSDVPSDAAIGLGVYDYLRQFPDCDHNLVYAELLRDAYPHYLADLGSQILMLDHKEVDGHYLRRKLSYMKILALLEPKNASLLQNIGMACYDLGLTYSEFMQSRYHLLAGMGFLQKSLRLAPDNLNTLNYLGQIDYFLGDYRAAARRWGGIAANLPEGAPRDAFLKKVRRIEQGEAPGHPLVDDLELIGQAMACYGNGEIAEACLIMERLEEEGTITSELPSAEFYYFLGMCRGKCGDSAGAFDAFDKALAIDSDFALAEEGKNIVLEGKPF